MIYYVLKRYTGREFHDNGRFYVFPSVMGTPGHCNELQDVYGIHRHL